MDAGKLPAASRWPAILAFASLLLAGAAHSDAPDLAQAEELLQAGQAADALVLVEQALEADPSSVGAHLGLGRAYYALGQYARARIEFETVLQYDNLSQDLHSLTQVYDKAAADYAAGRIWRPFYFAETGIGNYRENASSSTDIFGGAGTSDTFLPLRVGGGWNMSLTEQQSFNGSLDYRFRAYDDSDRRNDSDLRWNFNISRPVDDDSLTYGMRGRFSYQGEGERRNDWGVFADYRYRFNDTDAVTLDGEIRERRYRDGPIGNRRRERQTSSHTAELTGSWTHSLANGRTSLTFGGHLAREWAAQDRPDGDGSFWGFNGEIDHSFRGSLDVFFWWSYANEAYDDERPDFISDPEVLKVRNDDLWNFGGGLVCSFAPRWSLRPTFEYNREDSSIDALAYSSTEMWITVRKSF